MAGEEVPPGATLTIEGATYGIEREVEADGERCYLLRKLGETGAKGARSAPPPVRLITCREAHALLDAQRTAAERRVEKEAKRKAREQVERDERAERDEQERIARLVRNARAVRAAAAAGATRSATRSTGVPPILRLEGCGAYFLALAVVVACWAIWAIVEALVLN